MLKKIIMNKNIIIYLFSVGAGLILGFINTEEKLDYIIQKGSTLQASRYQGWSTQLNIAKDNQGNLLRAVIARIGLGANTAEEAIYLTSTEDSDQQLLNTKNDYQIIIEQEIPVHAFWSMTIYGEDNFLMKNEFKKYHLSSFDDLEKDSLSGKTIIYLSKDSINQSSNWLPITEGDQNFQVTLRCYNPSEKMIHNLAQIDLPVIKRIH